jgi:hypothetical protein
MFPERVGKGLKTKEMTCADVQKSGQRVRKLLNCDDLIVRVNGSFPLLTRRRGNPSPSFFVSIDSKAVRTGVGSDAFHSLSCPEKQKCGRKSAAAADERLPKADYTRELASRQENSRSGNCGARNK